VWEESLPVKTEAKNVVEYFSLLIRCNQFVSLAHHRFKLNLLSPCKERAEHPSQLLKAKQTKTFSGGFTSCQVKYVVLRRLWKFGRKISFHEGRER